MIDLKHTIFHWSGKSLQLDPIRAQVHGSLKPRWLQNQQQGPPSAQWPYDLVYLGQSKVMPVVMIVDIQCCYLLGSMGISGLFSTAQCLACNKWWIYTSSDMVCLLSDVLMLMIVGGAIRTLNLHWKFDFRLLRKFIAQTWTLVRN